ncbi:MAG: hypothetical protein KDA93_00540 [Planctomycetaceae bacterium]|nr:hypothetical protein [Planctomycetaceae bacterium]
MKRVIAHQKRNIRAAYTLVEMLIASILVATLMATVWNLTSLYSGFITAGRAQAEEQQLARSLIDIISYDLHSLTPDIAGVASFSMAPPVPTAPIGEDLFVEAPFPDETVPTVQGTGLFGLNANGRSIPTFDLRGQAHSLTLTVADVEPDIEVIPIDEETGEPISQDLSSLDAEQVSTEPNELPGPPLAPEYRRIVYEFVPPREIEVDAEEVREPGLYRYEIPIEHLSLLTNTDDLAGMATTDGETNVDDVIGLLYERGLTSIKRERIPEVVGCEFEYLSDRGWESSWTRVDEGRKLRAIRVQLRLLSPKEQGELMTALGADDTSEVEGVDELSEFDTELPQTDESLMAEFGEEDDPFAAFTPRTFERIILMCPVRRLKLGEGTDGTFGLGTGSFSTSTSGELP